MAPPGSVRRFLLTRSAQAATVILIVVTLAFVLIHAAPGDPFLGQLDETEGGRIERELLRRHWGYDRPLPVQYARWVSNLATGSLGQSHSQGRPVAAVLRETVPHTLLLMGLALPLGVLAGVALGTWQAARRGSGAERASSAISMVVLSVPEFLFALALLSVFALRLRWFPVSGMTDDVLHETMGGVDAAIDVLRHLVLPVTALAVLTAAAVSRYQRSAVLAVLPEEFVRAARARGATRAAALLRHAVRNALGPLIAIVGLMLPSLFAGAVFVENIFSWPGMGRAMVKAVDGRDYPLVLAAVLVSSVLVAAGGMVADLLASAADPRVRSSA